MLLLLLTLLGMAWADPDPNPLPPSSSSEDTGASTAPPERPSDAELLQVAIRNYQLRRRDLAIQQLAALALDEDASLAVRQEARIYLAEDRFFQEDRSGADAFFEQVVRADPDYQIDRFRHPPDVCAQFDLVRAAILPTLPAPLILQPRLRTPYRLLPLTYRLHYEVWPQPWQDGVLATAEWSLAASGTLMFAWYILHRDDAYLDTPEDRARATRFQIVHASVFVGWAGSAVLRRGIVRRDWKQNWQEYGGISLSPAGEAEVFLGAVRRF